MGLNRRSFIKLSTTFIGCSVISLRQAASFVSDSLKDLFKNLYFPTDQEFLSLKKTFNKLIKKEDPLAISKTSDLSETSRLLVHESFKDTPILMRSGGHSYAGFSTGKGLVLDSRLHKQVIYKEDSIVLGSGLMLKEAQDLLSLEGYTFPSGEFPGVGLAGYMLGGGHSRRSRYLGLGADVVKSMSVTLASGERIKSVSPDNHPDLFWALLGGGGGNFAYVDSFEIEKTPSFKDYFFKFNFPASVVNTSSEVFEFWEENIEEDPENIGVNITVYVQNGYIQRLIVSGVIMNVSKSLEELDEEFKSSRWHELNGLSPTRFESRLMESNFIRPSNMNDLYFMGSSHYADQYVGGDGFRHIKDSISKNTQGSNLYMGFYAMGGKINSPKRDVSYPHRDSKYMLDMFSNFREDKTKHNHFKQNFNSLHSAFEPIFSGRSYVNYPNLDFENWAERYYAGSLERLIRVKKEYDPKNRFDFGEHSISRLV